MENDKAAIDRHFLRIMQERKEHKEPLHLFEYIRRLENKSKAHALLHNYDKSDYYLSVITKLRIQILFETISDN